MAKVEKIYNVEVADGKIKVSMKRKGADGRFHSIQAPYPVYVNEKDADGNIVIKKLTRKQAETELVASMMHYYPNGIGY